MYLSLVSTLLLGEVAGGLGLSKPLLDLVINELDKGIVLKYKKVLSGDTLTYFKVDKEYFIFTPAGICVI